MGTETTTNPEHEDVPDTTPEADEPTTAAGAADEEEPLDDPDSTDEATEPNSNLEREIVGVTMQLNRLRAQRCLLEASPAFLDLLRRSSELEASKLTFEADKYDKGCELETAGWADDEIITQLEAMLNVFDAGYEQEESLIEVAAHELFHDIDAQIEAVEFQIEELLQQHLERMLGDGDGTSIIGLLVGGLEAAFSGLGGVDFTVALGVS